MHALPSLAVATSTPVKLYSPHITFGGGGGAVVVWKCRKYNNKLFKKVYVELLLVRCASRRAELLTSSASFTNDQFLAYDAQPTQSWRREIWPRHDIANDVPMSSKRARTFAGVVGHIRACIFGQNEAQVKKI